MVACNSVFTWKINILTYFSLQAGEKHQLPQLTKKGSISLDDIIAMLIRVFVDASPHVPEHRQLPLFTHLISTLGSMQFLHTAVLLLLERHVVHGASNPDGDKQVCVEVNQKKIPRGLSRINNIYNGPYAWLHQMGKFHHRASFVSKILFGRGYSF